MQRSFAGSNQRNFSNHPSSSFQQSSSSSRNKRRIGWAEIEKIDAQVKNKELLEGSADLLAAMDKESVYLRMDDIWQDFERQEVFLCLIVLTSRATHAGIQYMTQAFLRRTLQSKLVNCLEKNILLFGPHNQRAVNIVTSLAELLLLGWTTFPSLMADSLAHRTEYLILKVNEQRRENQQRSEQFPSKYFDDLLKRLDVAMKSILNRKNAGMSIEQGAGKAGGNRNNQQRWNDESTGPPAEDFRTIDVQLCKEDILAHNEAVYLRKAIVGGSYTDDEHYLDVQFRLLREDLCRPLRAGIHEYRANNNNNQHLRSNNRSGQQNSLLVYNNVNFMGVESHTQDGKILAYLRLSPRDQRRKLSRRFIFGSLICLSDDGFDNSFIFGTVVDRDGIDGGGRHQQQQPKNRRFTIEKRGCVGILLQSVTAASQLRQDIAYYLVESPAFYECYSHVLRALQSIRPGQPIPFSDYLVRMAQNPALPQYQYQRDNRPVLLNFSSILVRGPQGRPEQTRCASTQLTEQFTADQFGMDQSQFEAFAYALRSELAVIQGPPGTGKTFLGLKIVKLLFHNQHLWRGTQYEEDERRQIELRQNHEIEQQRPMLIVCYTNHALDQFLEGILAFLPKGIVRVGGQSKNEALEKFNLRQNGRNIDVDPAQRIRFWECRDELKRLDKSIQRMKEQLFGTTMDSGWIVSHSELFHQQEDSLKLELLELEHPFDTTLKQKYRAFFAENSCYESWLTSAKPVGSAAERLQIFTYVSHLVRQCHIPEEISKLAYIYYMSTGDWQMLDKLFEPSIQRASLERLRDWLHLSGREPEFLETIREWPTLAEVDSLLRIGLDEEVAVELLSSIKRDGQYREHLNQIRQHSSGGHQQQCSSSKIVEDLQEYDPDDDYADHPKMKERTGAPLVGIGAIFQRAIEQTKNQNEPIKGGGRQQLQMFSAKRKRIFDNEQINMNLESTSKKIRIEFEEIEEQPIEEEENNNEDGSVQVVNMSRPATRSIRKEPRNPPKSGLTLAPENDGNGMDEALEEKEAEKPRVEDGTALMATINEKKQEQQHQTRMPLTPKMKERTGAPLVGIGAIFQRAIEQTKNQNEPIKGGGRQQLQMFSAKRKRIFDNEQINMNLESTSKKIRIEFEEIEEQPIEEEENNNEDGSVQVVNMSRPATRSIRKEPRKPPKSGLTLLKQHIGVPEELTAGKMEKQTDPQSEVPETNEKNSAKLRKFLGKISTRTPLSDMEAQQMATGADQTDPWDLPLLTRWRLYKRWVQQWKPGVEEEHSRLIREYCAKRNELDELRSLVDIAIMRRAKVIGMTTTKAAHLQSALRSVKPRIVVVEEAAEVFEQHIVTALTECCEHLILIGDHQQLRPAPADYWLGKKYNLDISLFERLVLKGFEYRQLSLQHRMRPEIASTMMRHFYANLQDHSSVRGYPDALGLQKNLFFLNHSQPESSKQDEARSHANYFEAEFAVQLAKYLYKQGYEGSQITILCTYSDQFFDIRQRMGQCFGTDKSHGIRVDKVDNYQGEECDIIILSLVRSKNPMKRIGFLNTPNRVCVAMSRAKHGFYIFGNMDFLAQNCNTNSPNCSGAETSGKNLWADIKQSLQAAECIGSALPIVCQVHGNKQEIAHPKQFDELAPEGGCTQPCGVRMDCGHTCRKPCHAFDPEHTKMKCMEKCGRKCANELHNCPRWCYEECGPCYELVLRTLPCGHSQEAPCHLSLEDLHCKEPCPYKLSPCGHQCANNCSENCTEKCKVPTERKLACSHTMTLACHLDPLAQQCEKRVQKVWPICRHVALAKCCADPAQLSCPAPCGQPLADCEHPCAGTCGQCRRGRLHQDCAQDCTRILICGHECREKCAKVCPPCPLPCETACVHSKCSLKFKHPNNKKQQGGRKCGERCTPCAEKCDNRCAHQACSKKCSEPCDVDPCFQPCGKLLPCSISGPKPRKGSVNNSFQIVHPCIGVCGEPCLDICAICHPERMAEIKEIFFGYEEDHNARFVKLVDCGHIFEAKGLDKAIRAQLENRSTDGGDSAAIVVIKCPSCSTPIRLSNRYTKLLNERAVQIDKVKKKLLGDKTKDQLLAEWEELRKALDEKQLPCLPEITTSSAAEVEAIQKITDAFDKIKKKLRKCQNHEITSQRMVMYENIHRLLLGFIQATKRIFDSYALLDVGITAGLCGQHLYNALHNTIRVEHLREYLLRDLAELLRSLAKRKVRSLAEITLVQMSSELAQNTFLISIFHWVGTRYQQHERGDIDAKGEQMLTDLLSDMQAARAFNEQKGDFYGDEKLEQMFTDLVNHTGDVPISAEEMVQIKWALAGHVTKWYSCPKGHVYGIGECGQAMQVSQCIECRETVGGSGHQLVATNREAADLNREYHLRRAAENPFEARF